MLGTIIAVVYIAAGLFATLSGFGIVKPYKNDEKKRNQLYKQRFYYQFGGILIIGYGIYKLLN